MIFKRDIPFDLPLLPPKVDLNSFNFSDILISSRVALAELKGFSCLMPNPLLLLSPAIIRESIASSEIENIHTTIIDVLQNQLFPEKDRRKPDKEVLCYKDAVMSAYKMLEKYPISTRLIVKIKKQLIPESYESYRKQQNVIVNLATQEKLYTPPAASHIPKLIGNLEQFINDDNDNIDPLIKAAVAHYQFEAIHPFEDGNGRTGRILMVIYLIQRDLLKWPILYISGYINKNRNKYYKLLNNVTVKNEWHEFIYFMLEGFYAQAVETKEIIYKILELFNNQKEMMKAKHKKMYSADLVEALFSFPIITPVKLGKVLDIHYTTATRHLAELAKGGFLEESKIGKYRLFMNKELLKILEEK